MNGLGGQELDYSGALQLRSPSTDDASPSTRYTGDSWYSPFSTKRPHASLGPDLDCPTPLSRASSIHSNGGSPLWSMAGENHSVGAEALQHEENAFIMDWEPTQKEANNICYGAICEAKALFRGKAEVNRLRQKSQRSCQLHIEGVGQGFALSTAARDSEPIAFLDSSTCAALRCIQELGHISFEAVLQSSHLSVGPNASSGRRLIIPVSINIYGPFTKADQVGSTLSSPPFHVYLQHPFQLDPGYQYYNPQMYRTGVVMENLTHLVGMTDQDFRAKAISDEVENILDSLDNINDRAYGDMGHSAIPEVSRALQPSGVAIQLKDHQLGAIAFIRRREHHGYCQNVVRMLQRHLNLPQESAVPSFTTGGILADSMGLGKTLTMISAVVDSLEDAKKHLEQRPSLEQDQLPSKATLVVVSSMQVLNVWETEIESRLTPGTIKTYKFHGQSRATNPGHMSNYDIVLTTYGVLAADCKSRGVLQKVLWFRVVLDEAHWIRNPTSKQHRAAHALNSARRWCLTGTPIQNRLDDLRSLLSFLHFEPFCRQAVFQRYILDPLREENEDRSSRLRGVLGAVCLRRGEKLLNLPEPQFQQVSLTFRESERALYNSILKQCQRDIDDKVSSGAKLKKYGILFAAIMKLRRVCNHGSLSAPPTNNPTRRGIDNSAISTEETGCDFCTGSGEEKLDWSKGDICPQCGNDPTLLPASDSLVPSTDMAMPVTPAITVTSEDRAFSTKVEAVINRLKQSDFGAKSLVFSYWTTTLDLLQRHMQETGISCLRIDGRVSHDKRLLILKEFRNTEIPVLLMTIQTGAVGLNLTAANNVHIVEPQWNPSVEEQAIARAVRMGQTRTVTVIRYVVKNSVEENIVNLQKRKRSLAKFTLDGTSDDGISGSLDDLKFVLDFGSVKM